MTVNLTPEFVTALVAARAEFPAVKKDKSNPAYKGATYADLDSIIEAVTPTLCKYGLFVSQVTETRVAGDMPYMVIKTTLMHTSGGYVQSEYLVGYDDNAQKLGGKVTYARRYDLQAILGITAEPDDDGNFVSGVSSKQQATPSVQPTTVTLGRRKLS